MTTPARLSPSRVAEIRDQNEHDRRGLRFAQGQRMAATIDDLLAERDRVSALLRTPEVRELRDRLRELERTCIGHRDSETAGDAQERAWHERAEVAHRAADLLAALGAEGTGDE